MALIADKKTIQALGSQMNMNAAAKPSAYAFKMMQKMGWKEGSGLGKNEDGNAKHIVIHKREDSVGLGNDKNSTAAMLHEQWCHKSFSNKLDSFKAKLAAMCSDDDDDEDKAEKKKKRKDKSKKRSRKERDSEAEIISSDSKKARVTSADEDEGINIDYDALFKATGGARLGMRARREQKGKIKRTEGSVTADSATK